MTETEMLQREISGLNQQLYTAYQKIAKLQQEKTNGNESSKTSKEASQKESKA